MESLPWPGNLDTAGKTAADHTSSGYHRADESMSGDNSRDDDDGDDDGRQRQRVRSTVRCSGGEGQRKFS